MTIQLKKHYRHWTPGSIVSTLGRGICDELIRRGVAVAVKQMMTATRDKQVRFSQRNK